MYSNAILVVFVIVLEARKVLVAFVLCAANSNELCLVRPPSRSRPLARPVPSTAELRRNEEHKWTQRGQACAYDTRCDLHYTPGARCCQCSRCVGHIELHKCRKAVDAGEKHTVNRSQ